MPFLRFGDGGDPWYSSGKDKFFFFWGQEWKTISRLAALKQVNMPTTTELNGDFRFRLRGADGVVGTSDDGVLRDPAVAGTCSTANRTAMFRRQQSRDLECDSHEPNYDRRPGDLECIPANDGSGLSF
jgi:hypothetical protein